MDRSAVILLPSQPPAVIGHIRITRGSMGVEPRDPLAPSRGPERLPHLAGVSAHGCDSNQANRLYPRQWGQFAPSQGPRCLCSRVRSQPSQSTSYPYSGAFSSHLRKVLGARAPGCDSSQASRLPTRSVEHAIRTCVSSSVLGWPANAVTQFTNGAGALQS